MVTRPAPSESDDDFDLIPNADAVSNVSDEDTDMHPMVPANDGSGAGGRLAGPHEVPQVPFASEYDTVLASIDEKLSHQTIGGPREEFREDARVSKGSGSFIKGGLSYTKSVYNKFMKDDALIAVMGMTGSGKTTFISKVTGRTDLRIGHDLTSCTQDIQVVETKINGQTVRFVDTPGFSDTNLSDTEVLQLIADYLAVAYKKEMKLSGIIYLHPISDRRVTHHTTKNLEMFRKLTGERNLSGVVLATSMWGNVTEEEGIKREDELKGKYWRLLLAMGAKTARHSGTPESARKIATTLLGNTPFYLQLQEEMGKDNKALRDTAAGREVMLELVRMKEEHQRELEDVKNMMKSSAEESKEALKQYYQEKLGEMQRTLSDEKRMNEAAMRSLEDRNHALEDRVHALEKRKPGCIVM